MLFTLILTRILSVFTTVYFSANGLPENLLKFFVTYFASRQLYVQYRGYRYVDIYAASEVPQSLELQRYSSFHSSSETTSHYIQSN